MLLTGLHDLQINLRPLGHASLLSLMLVDVLTKSVLVFYNKITIQFIKPMFNKVIFNLKCHFCCQKDM